MIKDRGFKKWSSLMLPEHVALLNEWRKKDHWQEKPILDDQKKEEMDRLICEAMEGGYDVQLTIWHQGTLKQVVGQIHYYDSVLRQLRITMNEKMTVVNLPTIISIEKKLK